MSSTERDPEPEPIPKVWPTLQVLYSVAAKNTVATTVVLSSPTIAIGRTKVGPDCIVLRDDRRVSERHAELHIRWVRPECPPEISIMDTGSTNGTFVNGLRVSECKLRDGDILRTGESFLLFRYERAWKEDVPSDVLLGSAPCMRQVRSQLAQVAPRDDTVLLFGESGTGKEVSAKLLHDASKRVGRLISVNCAAIPQELAESQLFGHERGAFSGAYRAHEGYFRAAHAGTLFLDEIGDLPPVLQPKLLRVLEERMVTPLGSTRASPCDIRLIAATNRDLRPNVPGQSFRGDLYARISSAIIRLPPLRARREDILSLLLREFGTSVPLFTARLIEALLIYHWPYNVRELKQVAALLRMNFQPGKALDLPLIADRLLTEERPPAEERAPKDESSLPEAPSREILLRLLAEHQGVVSRVAAAVQRSHRQVRRLLEKYGIDNSPFKVVKS